MLLSCFENTNQIHGRTHPQPHTRPTPRVTGTALRFRSGLRLPPGAPSRTAVARHPAPYSTTVISVRFSLLAPTLPTSQSRMSRSHLSRHRHCNSSSSTSQRVILRAIAVKKQNAALHVVASLSGHAVAHPLSHSRRRPPARRRLARRTSRDAATCGAVGGVVQSAGARLLRAR